MNLTLVAILLAVVIFLGYLWLVSLDSKDPKDPVCEAWKYAYESCAKRIGKMEEERAELLDKIRRLEGALESKSKYGQAKKEV